MITDLSGLRMGSTTDYGVHHYLCPFDESTDTVGTNPTALFQKISNINTSESFFCINIS